jgi:coenzyme Q-binding protein COQ10
MKATTIDTVRRLPYAPRDLCAMVGDMKAYPRFVPWIKSLRVTGEREHDGVTESIAHVVVGWRHITERFSTKVRTAPEEGAVDVAFVEGPFRTLANTWRFESDGAGGAIVRFHLAYDFKGLMLNALVRANKEKVIAKIMEAFEGEAKRRFGAPKPAGSA